MILILYHNHFAIYVTIASLSLNVLHMLRNCLELHIKPATVQLFWPRMGRWRQLFWPAWIVQAGGCGRGCQLTLVAQLFTSTFITNVIAILETNVAAFAIVGNVNAIDSLQLFASVFEQLFLHPIFKVIRITFLPNLAFEDVWTDSFWPFFQRIATPATVREPFQVSRPESMVY